MHLEDQVDDVLELRVGDMRHVPAAEADVIADAILRDAVERVVERVDPQLRPVAIFLRALLDQMVVHVGEHGVVDLQHEAGLDHFEIFLAHRAGDREHVVALAGVVLVGGVVADARRRDAVKNTSSVGAAAAAAFRLARSRRTAAWPR